MQTRDLPLHKSLKQAQDRAIDDFAHKGAASAAPMRNRVGSTGSAPTLISTSRARSLGWPAIGNRAQRVVSHG